ncbi:uncharacterized protein [Henckelia pumila]|uniref:uncharacterized protein n=1 Tax=Henckelia pumila TaxID=405737 RepID=UPI003C6E2124
MTVVEYTSKFNELGSYAPKIMGDDDLKLHRFKKGLNICIQLALVVYQPAKFADLMRVAIRAKSDIKHRESDFKNKRPLTNQSSQNGQKSKRPNLSGGASKGTFTAPNRPSAKLCLTCNFQHERECRRKAGACFNYGNLAHRIADCPKPVKPRNGSNANTMQVQPKETKSNACVFAITQEEAEDANEVVAELISEKLTEPLRVATPASKIIKTLKVHRKCRICIHDQTLDAELVELNMVEFDVILGMDWLSKNHAVVNCRDKNVKLRTPNHEEITFQGKTKSRKPLLPTSQAWKVMKSGEEVYLAMVNEVKEEMELKMEDIPIVREFPDVFPKELPGMVPDREIEFEIQL